MKQTSLGVERVSRAAEELESVIDLNVYFDNTGLQNLELARRLLKAIILPRDWKATKSHRLTEVVSSPYPTLLKVKVSFLYSIFA